MSSLAVEAIITEALQELNVYMPGVSADAPDAAFCLSKLNQIFDNWNAERRAVWCDIFSSFTLTDGLSPHTIGPTGATWTMAIRPVTLDGCFLNLNTQTPNVFVEIDRINKETYERYISVPSIATSIPTCVYYEKDFPNGKLFFYPVPNYAYEVRISSRQLLAAVALTDSINFPPGYQSAITLTLEEDICTGMGRTVPDIVSMKARQARARIFANNTEPLLVNFKDGQQDDRRSNYNYHDRSLT